MLNRLRNLYWSVRLRYSLWRMARHYGFKMRIEHLSVEQADGPVELKIDVRRLS